MASTLIPGLGPRDEVPRPNPRIDPVAAGLSAQEGWVFSRVDGHTTFGELFHITGLGESQTVEILKSLVARGLVLTRIGGGVSSPATNRPRTIVPPVAAGDELERFRAEMRAADDAAQTAARVRERSVAEEMAAQRAIEDQKE